MAKQIDYECQKCSQTNWRGKVQPECFVGSACYKKRSWYRKIDHYREMARKNHHYIKYVDGKCAICDSIEALQAHHIEPQLIGGLHTKTNIMTLCESCHRLITKYYQAIRGLAQVDL